MKNSTDVISLLKITPLFQSISESEIISLLPQMNLINKYFEKDEVILLQGTPYDSLHILIEGSIYGEISNFENKNLRVGYFKAPYCISPGIIFAEDNRLPSTLTALTRCRFFLIHKTSIFQMCMKNQLFLNNVLTLMSNTAAFLAKKLYFHTFYTIKEKIIHFLLSLPESNGRVELPVSIEELSAQFGVARPALSRAFSELEQNHWIKKTGKTVVFLKKECLISIIQ